MAGTGDGSVNGTIVFNSVRQLQRPGLVLLNGVVYSAWGSHGDNGPFHGWLLGHNAATLSLVSAFNTTPKGGLGAVWMGGAGPAADASANIYFSTGNGTFAVTGSLSPAYGDSVLKLSNGGTTVADYFTPWDQADFAVGDLDFGSGGLMVLPDQPGPYPHLLITATKTGRVYLLDRDNLGGYRRCGASCDSVIQLLPDDTLGGVWSTPAYFNGWVYYHGANDVLKAYQISGGLLSSTPTLQTETTFRYPGATEAYQPMDPPMESYERWRPAAFHRRRLSSCMPTTR